VDVNPLIIFILKLTEILNFMGQVPDSSVPDFAHASRAIARAENHLQSEHVLNFKLINEDASACIAASQRSTSWNPTVRNDFEIEKC